MSKKNIWIGVLSFLFIVLIVLIKTNIIKSFDTFIYSTITFKMNDLITVIYKIFTFLGSTSFIVGLCAFFLVLFIILKKTRIGAVITGCLIISTIFNNVIKIIIRRPRPEVLALVYEKTFSFPSGHMMASASMAGILLYLVSKSTLSKKAKLLLKTLLVILPLLIGMSRIYLGAHFASDILGGAMLSIILLLIEISIIEKKKLI